MEINNHNGRYSVQYEVNTSTRRVNNQANQNSQQAPRPTMSALPKRDISPAARRISMESYDPCIVRVVTE